MVADAGYWHTTQIQALIDRGPEVLVPPDGAMREGKRPGWEDGIYDEMRDKLATEDGARTTRCARSPSSRSTDRSNTTAASPPSCDEAEPRCSQSGD